MPLLVGLYADSGMNWMVSGSRLIDLTSSLRTCSQAVPRMPVSEQKHGAESVAPSETTGGRERQHPALQRTR